MFVFSVAHVFASSKQNLFKKTLNLSTDVTAKSVKSMFLIHKLIHKPLFSGNNGESGY